MRKPQRTRALAVGVAAMVAQLAFPAAHALAASGTPVIYIFVTSGPPGSYVSVGGRGCITPNGQPNTVQLFVRGPGASTNSVGRFLPAFGNSVQTYPNSSTGEFNGLVQIPVDAALGSTYKVSGQCTEAGQPPGPESTGVVFTVAGTTVTVAGYNTIRLSGGLTGIGLTGIGLTGTSGTGASTADLASTPGAAKPIPAQPGFTG